MSIESTRIPSNRECQKNLHPVILPVAVSIHQAESNSILANRFIETFLRNRFVVWLHIGINFADFNHLVPITAIGNDGVLITYDLDCYTLSEPHILSDGAEAICILFHRECTLAFPIPTDPWGDSCGRR